VADSPNTIAAHTAGNPLAAGLIAFGIGWLIGSLLPVSEQEQQAAVKVKEAALPVVSDAAKEVADNLKEPAQQAVDTVKESATVAVETVKDESSSAAQDVKEQAPDAKDTVQQNR
jgi:FtsZ-binding cell division protein ZapB